MKVEKDEFLIDDGKSAMMTMRRRPLAFGLCVSQLDDVRTKIAAHIKFNFAPTLIVGPKCSLPLSDCWKRH